MSDSAQLTLSYICDLIDEGIWDWDIQTGNITCSQSWSKLLGYGKKCITLSMHDWKSNIHPDDYQNVIDKHKQCLSGTITEYQIKYRFKQTNNDYLWVLDSVKVFEKMPDNTPKRIIGAITNITTEQELELLVAKRTRDLQEEKELLEQRLIQAEHHASFDLITGLYNRRAFEKMLSLEINRTSRFSACLSIILLDIDNFKSFNDAYGHKAGDNILIALAKLLSEHVRQYDIVARWGGEEFAIILPNTHKVHASEKAEKLRTLIEKNLKHDGQTLTCSFGVTTLNPSDNENSVFIRADKALYLAKNNNRNNVKVI